MQHSQNRLPGREEDSEPGSFEVRFPDLDEASVPQDAEYCLVRREGRTRRIRFHDYHEIYAIPGLYEHIFYEKLACQSPALLVKLLEHEVERAGLGMEELTVLDVGAGNGIMGELLAGAGVNGLVGVDILAEAALAAQRDRPGVYDAYHAVDLLHLPQAVYRELDAQPFNGLTMIAALGFGDIPPEAFTVAYNFIADGGLVTFNLRDVFMEGGDASGFAQLIRRMVEQGWLEELIRVRYVHRLSITGEPLYYTGIVGRKHADLPTAQPVRRRDN
ncbi:MAG TPA: class I SAM-dependent methyltransferase [bacterium]